MIRMAEPTSADRDRSIWSVLAIAVTAQTAGSFVAQGAYVMVPIWRTAFETTLAAASLGVTVMNAGQILTMYALGRAIDRHGERNVVSAMMVCMGACAALAAVYAESLAGILVGMVGLGAAYAAVQPGGTRAILRWFPPRHRGLATGFRQAAVPLGTALAAGVLPIIASTCGWRFALGTMGAGAALGGLFFWGCYREPRDQPTRAESPLRLGQLLRVLSGRPAFWSTLAAGVAMSAFQFTLTAHIIGYLVHRLGVSLVEAAALFSIAQLVGIPGRILLPWSSDRYFPGERARSLACTMLLAVLPVAAFVTLDADVLHVMIMPLLVLLGMFGIGWFPLYLIEIAEAAPKSSIATTVGFATTLCMIAMASGPWAFGWLVDRSGYGAAWAALTAPVVTAAILLLCTQRAAPEAQQL